MNVVLYNLQDFINTLDSLTIKKLCIRSLRWGIGSLDYIDSLLIVEDDLDNDNDEVDIAEAHSPATEASIAITPPPQPIPLQGQGPRGVYVGIAATCPWRWRKCAVGKKL